MAKKLCIVRGSSSQQEDIAKMMTRFGAQDAANFDFSNEQNYYFVDKGKCRFIPGYIFNILKDYLDVKLLRPRKFTVE